MSIIKKLLSPIYVAIFVVILIASVVVHLYVGHCQTSKWHYMLQRYYCPSWYKPDLEFKNRDYKRWRVWNKEGQMISSLIINENGDVGYKSWYDSGQMKKDYFASDIDAKGDQVEVDAYGYTYEHSDGFDLCIKRKESSEWHENGTKSIYLQVNSKRNISRYWYENGQLSVFSVFNQDKTKNTHESWDRKGVLYSKSFFNIKLGRNENYLWYGSGKKKCEYFFIDDFHESTWWYENGQRKSLIKSKGRLLSVKKEWYQNGQLKSSFDFKKMTSFISCVGNKESSIGDDFLTNKEVYHFLLKYNSSESFKNYIEENIKDKKLNLNQESYIRFLVKGIAFYGFENFEISSAIKNDVLSYDVNIFYLKKDLEKIKDAEILKEHNVRIPFGKIKIKLVPEGVILVDKLNTTELMKTFSYIDGEITHYLENGDIDYIQTNNKYGVIQKVDLYEKGRVIKTVYFDK